MIEADKPNFCKTLLGLALVKPPYAKLAPEAYEIWWQALEDWPLDEFQRAAAHLAKSMEFMPSPYHFEQLRKAGRPTPGEAWERARKACGSAIQLGQVTHNGTCGDPMIDRVVRAIGGYGVIAMSDTDKLHFLEKRFAEHYEAIEQSDDVREALPQVVEDRRAGIHSNVRQLMNGKNSLRQSEQQLAAGPGPDEGRHKERFSKSEDVS